jgi:foldase protein PrsA
VRGVLITTIAAVAGMTGCGGDRTDPAVVHVARAVIGKASVDHWTRTIERGATPGRSLAQGRGTPRQRAVEFLISSQWLIGEAAKQGAPVSGGDVDRALNERREVDGDLEFEQELNATGRSIADARLEVRAELAAAAIRRGLAQQAADVSEKQITAFYSHNLQPFRHHEGRVVELIENLPSPSAAEALVRRIGTGKAFSKRAYHEEVAENTDHSLGTPTKAAVMRAIFAARPNVVSRPMPLSHAWAVFIVRKIEPATVRPLAEVRAEVVEKLTALRRRRITAAFAKGYEQRWRARTSCRPGYVVQRCAQYNGPLSAEAEQFASG